MFGGRDGYPVIEQVRAAAHPPTAHLIAVQGVCALEAYYCR